jgi:7,8-dihydropterin-6-yl-methyl-4-(beta-D-ribofuranosyl)aminobenzene 5'-phosphate synthase
LAGVRVSGEIPRTTAFETGDPNLKVRKGQDFEVDLLPDDQALLVEQAGGIVVVLGCAHAGVINTLRHAMQVTGRDRVKAVIGGSHLMFLGPEQLESTIEELKAIDPELMAFSHCTGQIAARRLYQEFEGRFVFNQTGSVINLED